MNNDKGRLNYGVGLDNSQLRVGVAESRRLLQGIGQTAVDEGARIDDSFKRIGRTVAGVFAVSQIKDFITHVATVRGEFQQLEIAFKTDIHNIRRAFRKLKKLVLHTCVDIPAVCSGICNNGFFIQALSII